MSIWHPFTSLKHPIPNRKVTSASGAYLHFEDGHEILDCISSWWVNLFGHSRSEIAEAIYEQAKTLEHVMFAGFTHEPAQELVSILQKELPAELERFFFSDDGSTSVEVALKMAFQFWKNQGEERRAKFIAFDGAYHGDTLGAMSVGSRSIFTEAFQTLLFDVDYLPYPETFDDDAEVQAKENASLKKLQDLLHASPDRYAALIVEPLVQGAGGMRMCRPEFLQALGEVCQKKGILLIYDEVMTGFGRTGERFACTKAGTTPDIICLSKGLTGGSMPLAVTVCTDHVMDAFRDEKPSATFYHGHSYTANPLGCAAAIAAQKLLKEYQTQFQTMESKHQQRLNALRAKFPENVHRPRVCGTISAFNYVTSESQKTEYLHPISTVIREKAFAKGFLVRPLGNVVYLMPPYCVTNSEIDGMYDCIEEILMEL